MSKGETTRTAIIERAFALGNEVGLNGISLGVLADNLKLSKSGLFAHFKSKEALQLAVLQYAINRFIIEVTQPALAQPPGEPQVRALFTGYLDWMRRGGRRCFFMALAQEYDDRPGAISDQLIRSQQQWQALIVRTVQGAVAAGHFRADLDPAQFTYEFQGIAMSFQFNAKLFADPTIDTRAQVAFDTLIAQSRA